MAAAIGPRVTAGLALLTASVVSAAPATAAQPDVRVSDQAVKLAADSSLLNITHNAVNAILNAPMAHLEGIQRLSAALEHSASWWVYSPVNVLGWDPANPEMAKGVVDLLVPFKAVSTPVGEQVNAWFAANLPMYVGCTGIPPCPDISGMFDRMFTVPFVQLFTEGYTYSEPAYSHNPVSEGEGYWSQELGQIGGPVEWYGQTVKLNIMDVPNAIKNYLTGTPEPVRLPTLGDVVKTYSYLAKALWGSFYPWVPTSLLWNPEYSLSAYLTRPFAPLLCPSCNPYDPYMPVDWEPGDPTAPGGYVPPARVMNSPRSSAAVSEAGPVADAQVELTSGATASQEEIPAVRTTRLAGRPAESLRVARRGGGQETPKPSAVVKPSAAEAAGDATPAESPREAKRVGHPAKPRASAGSGDSQTP